MKHTKTRDNSFSSTGNFAMEFRRRERPDPLPTVAVLFASYEERCTSVARQLAATESPSAAFVFYCEDLRSEATIRNAAAIEKLLGSRAQVIPVSYKDPTKAIAVANRIPFEPSVLLDVSCFNRGNLFPFLWASGLGRMRFPRLLFAYTPALSYGDWLTRDFHPARNLIGYSGGINFSKQRYLICLVGYESDRVLEVIKAVEPSRLVIAVGTIPTRTEFYERNWKTVKEVMGWGGSELVQLEVGDPQTCREQLQTIVSQWAPSSAVHFAPFNTKLSCLAIWSLWLSQREVRVWNAQPETYNVAEYSKGCGSPQYYEVSW